MASMLDNPFAQTPSGGWSIGDSGGLSSGTIGGGSSLAAAFNPVTGGAINADPTASLNWANIAKQLQSLGQGTGQQSGGDMSMPTAQAGQAQSGAYGPRAPVSLNQLVQMLRNRTDQYLQSAMNPQTAKPVQIQRPPGLLGY